MINHFIKMLIFKGMIIYSWWNTIILSNLNGKDLIYINELYLINILIWYI